ncbi:response regulator [Ruegeria sp. HKCCA5491]|uniref:adenylate/guanylate cyclase domain-containing protein n=1 Tax=Ruegeria sp. HKCCA5491 TaxID=2682986 RepID=UPI0014877141
MTPPRILVVDDEPDLEALISQKFRRRVRKGELDLLFAHDGKHALEVLEENPKIDIVLSDINMPRMDGLTLLERLSEMETDLQTVMVSAYGDMNNIRAAMNRGAFDFVTKPIEFEDLDRTIAKTLEHLELLRQLRTARDNAEQARLTLSRYFSPTVVETLSRDPEAIEAKGERRVATFLFTDLADFTQLVESSDSDLIVEILNEYLDGMTRTIFSHGGTVMKIIGDAIQVIFGAPVDDPEHAAHAVACALALDEFAQGFQKKLLDRGIALGDTRIGVNSGGAIIGNFGGKSYFDYTAYGDAVNTAARLEQANKTIGTRICTSESVAKGIDNFSGRPIGRLLLKGKTQAVTCYEPLSEALVDSDQVRDYKAAYELLEASDPKARQSFAALLVECEDDPLILFHLGRLLAGETGVDIEAVG